MTSKTKGVQLRDNVLAKIKEIEEFGPVKYKTSCMHTPHRSAAVINIKTANPGDLRKVCSDLMITKMADDHLGYDSTRNGYPVSEWLEDARSRADQLKRNAKLQQLKELEKKSMDFLSDGEIQDIKFAAVLEQFESL